MKVIAKQLGYFGKLREPGDEFEVPEGSKASWFVPVEKVESKKPKANDTGKDLV
jgi:hypothetical protein